MSDVDDVKAAVATYHAALSSLNIAKIETLWAHDDSVTQLEPTSKAIIHGWKAVKKGLEDFFGGFSEVKISQADGPHVRVKGDAAWATGRTHAVAKTKAGEAMTLNVFDTQIFEKRGGAWLVVSNIALPVPQ
jgi:ketosteroid isomerase-like protein